MTTTYTALVVAVDSIVVSAKAAHRGATIVVRKDSTEVEADDSGDYVIDLTLGGSTVIAVEVTAVDGVTRKRYVVWATRRVGTKAQLAVLSLPNIALIPPFNPDSEQRLYTATVIGLSEVVLTASAALGGRLEVAVDGRQIAANSDNEYAISLLRAGVQPATTHIVITVESEDGVTQTNYTLAIRRKADEDTRLQSLRVVDLAGDVVVLTTRSQTVYDVLVSKETQVELVVAASGVAAELLVTVAEETLVSEDGRYAVDLAIETTTVLVIEVAAQNGSSAIYTIRFRQEADGDANLRKLELTDNLGNALRLVPAFVAEEVVYQSALSGATHAIVQAAVAALRSAREGGQVAVATLRVNGMPLADDTPSEPLELELGTTTTVVIEVRAQDGTTKAYVVEIAQIAQVRSAEADLTTLSLVDDLEGLVEVADFDADREQYEIELVGTSALRLMPRASAGASIVVRAAGASMIVASDRQSPAIELNLAGVTTITIVVTSRDESSSKTYILIISQIKNDEALLDGLSLEAGGVGGVALQLVPGFSTAILSYATTVTAYESVVVMPRVSLGARIMISDSEASTSVEVMNNQASAPIDLLLGTTTTLVIRVASQDESSTMAYSVAIKHYFGRDAILESLEFEPPGNRMPLTPKFLSRHTTYTIAYFDLDATQLRLSASVGAEVALRVNGELLAPQEQLGTYLIDLTRVQEIMITVSAQAVAVGSEVGIVGETQNTYTITLNRTASGLLIRTKLFLEAPLQ